MSIAATCPECGVMGGCICHKNADLPSWDLPRPWPETTDLVDLVSYGYALGGYQCQCLTCRQHFTGDKRSIRCKRCAMDAREAQLSIQTAPEEPARVGLPSSPSAAYAQGWREGWIAAWDAAMKVKGGE